MFFWVGIIVILICVMLEGFFSGSEIALISIDKIKLRHLVDEGSRGAKQAQERFQCELLRPVLDFSQIWFERVIDKITFHDPLSAGTIFDDQICDFEKGDVQIEMKNEKL